MIWSLFIDFRACPIFDVLVFIIHNQYFPSCIISLKLFIWHLNEHVIKYFMGSTFNFPCYLFVIIICLFFLFRFILFIIILLLIFCFFFIFFNRILINLIQYLLISWWRRLIVIIRIICLKIWIHVKCFIALILRIENL